MSKPKPFRDLRPQSQHDEFDPTLAPPGYRAVKAKWQNGSGCCTRCAFGYRKRGECGDIKCIPSERPDGLYVYFVGSGMPELRPECVGCVCYPETKLGEVYLDGDFNLDDLKKIVAYMERLP